MANKKFISGTLTTVDKTGNNVVMFPKTRAKDVIYPNMSNVENVTNNMESKLNNCCTHWVDGNQDGSVYLTTSANQKSTIGYSSIAGGFNAATYGNNSIALGTESVVHGNNSVAVGQYSSSDADSSAVFGVQSSINKVAINSTAVGREVKLFSANTVAIGQSLNIGPSNIKYGDTNWSKSNSAMFGFGSNNTALSNSMLISHNCNNVSLINSVAMLRSSRIVDANNNNSLAISSALFGINLTASNRSAIFGISDAIYGAGVAMGDLITLRQNKDYPNIENYNEIAVGARITSANTANSDFFGSRINVATSINSSTHGSNITTKKATSSFIAGQVMNMNVISNSIVMGYRLDSKEVSLDASIGNSLVMASSSNLLSRDSVAITYNSSMNINSSTFVGKNITAQNISSSVAMGSNISMDSGREIVAIGSSLNVSAMTITIGGSTNVTKNNSIGIGTSVNVTAADSVGIGYLTKVTGNRSTSVGYGSNSSNTYAVAIGANSVSNGSRSISIGAARVYGEGSTGIGMGALVQKGAENSLVVGSYQNATDDFNIVELNNSKHSFLLGENISANGNQLVVIGEDTRIPTWGDYSSKNMIIAGSNISLVNSANLNTQSYPKDSLVIGDNIRTCDQDSITIGNNIWSQTNSAFGSRKYGADISIGENLRINSAMTETIGYNSTVNAVRSFIIANSAKVGTGSFGIMTDSISVVSNGSVDIQKSAYIGVNSNAIKNVTGSLAVTTNPVSFNDTTWLQPNNTKGRIIQRSVVASEGSRIDCSDSILVGNNNKLEHAVGCVVVGRNISDPNPSTGPQSIGLLKIGKDISTVAAPNDATLSDKKSAAIMIGDTICTGMSIDKTTGMYIGKNISIECWTDSELSPEGSIVLGDNLATVRMRNSILVGSNSANANEQKCTSATVRNMYSSIGIITNSNKSLDSAVQDVESSITIMNGITTPIGEIKYSTLFANTTKFGGYRYSYYYNNATGTIEYERQNMGDRITSNVVASSNSGKGIDYSSIECMNSTFNAPLTQSIIHGSKININGYIDLSDTANDAARYIEYLKKEPRNVYMAYPHGIESSIIIGNNVSGSSASGSLVLGDNSKFVRLSHSLVMGTGHSYNGTVDQSIITGNATRALGNVNSSILIGKNVFLNNNITSTSKNVTVSAFGTGLTITLNNSTPITNSITVVGQNTTSSLLNYEHTFAIGDNGWVFSASNNSIRGKTYTTMGSDYAELMEWNDGNPSNSDRCGRFVSLAHDGNQYGDIKIQLASGSDDEYLLGIVSGDPSIIGNGDMVWKNKYKTDKFGRIIYEIDSSGNKVPILNPLYDSSREYTIRSERPEWDAIGLRGFVNTLDDGSCIIGSYVKSSNDGIATLSNEKTRFVCVARLSEDVIKVDIH